MVSALTLIPFVGIGGSIIYAVKFGIVWQEIVLLLFGWWLAGMGITFGYHRLFAHYGYFDLWSIWFRQLFILVPLIIMAPGLFTGAYTLGIMMQTNQAFTEIKDSFNILIYNWTRITELRSIHKRLSEFEKAIGYKNPDRLSPGIVRS